MKQTAVEWLETQIDNELKVIDNLYGKEIIGRKIAFAFVKRILIEAKEMEKGQLNDACYDGYYQEGMYDTRAYYDNKYKQQYKKNSQTN